MKEEACFLFRTTTMFLLCMFFISLQVAMAENFTFSTGKGSSNGILAESILREAYQRINIKINVKRLPPKRSVFRANQGKTDGELQRIYAIGKKFPNLIRVPQYLFTLDGVAFTKNVDFAVNGKESLKPYRLGIVNGQRFAEFITKDLPNTVNVKTNNQLISK